MRKPELGDQVIITRSGYHEGVRYHEGEIWEVVSDYSDKCLVCKRDGSETKIMWTDGKTDKQECKLYVPVPKIINQYEIY